MIPVRPCQTVAHLAADDDNFRLRIFWGLVEACLDLLHHTRVDAAAQALVRGNSKQHLTRKCVILAWCEDWAHGLRSSSCEWARGIKLLLGAAKLRGCHHLHRLRDLRCGGYSLKPHRKRLEGRHWCSGCRHEAP